jgi:hypothetical protein
MSVSGIPSNFFQSLEPSCLESKLQIFENDFEHRDQTRRREPLRRSVGLLLAPGRVRAAVFERIQLIRDFNFQFFLPDRQVA